MCKGTERSHMHHIIPKYMGGTDALENLVEVTVEQHAMYHWCNYQLWGNKEDQIAWLALSGQISFNDATIEAQRLGGIKANKTFKEKMENDQDFFKKISDRRKELWRDEEYRNKVLPHMLKSQKKAIIAALSEESRQKRLDTLKKIGHQQGKKNSQYGKMWITNGTKEGTYRINKTDKIPEGFWKGRICYDVKPKGKTASTYNRMWINNGINTKLIPKNDPIPEGYKKGRS